MLLRWTWQDPGDKISRPEAVPPCWDNIQCLLSSSINQGDEWGAPGWALLSPILARKGQVAFAGVEKPKGQLKQKQLKSVLVLLWEVFSHGFSWGEDCSRDSRVLWGSSGINENLWKLPRCLKWTELGVQLHPWAWNGVETKSGQRGRQLPQRMDSLLPLSSLLLNSTFYWQMQSKTNELLITLAQRIIRQSNFIWGALIYVSQAEYKWKWSLGGMKLNAEQVGILFIPKSCPKCT